MARSVTCLAAADGKDELLAGVLIQNRPIKQKIVLPEWLTEYRRLR